MSIADKILLWKQALIETVNGELKNIAQIELMPTLTELRLTRQIRGGFKHKVL